MIQVLLNKDLEDLLNLGLVKIEFAQQANNNPQERYKTYLQMLHESFFTKNKDCTSASEELKLADDDQFLVSKTTLLDMGFSSKDSEKALNKSNYSLKRAINYLLGRKCKITKEESKEVNETIIMDPKHLLFSNITRRDLKENSILNYFRHIICSLDSVLEYCCICRDKLPVVSTKIKC